MIDLPLFAALDVSLQSTAICIVDADGAIHRECTAPTEPEAIAAVLEDARDRLARIGLEAWPLSEWLSDGLGRLGFEVALMETRQVRAALSAMVVKTDRKDARGMAQLLRAGWFRPVHVKTADAREQRALLSARSTLVARLRDIENSLRGLLRGFGLRIPRSLGQRWEATVRDCLEGHATLLAIFEPLLAARRALQEQLALLDGRVRDRVRADPVCRRLMTAPGVGPVVALTFRAAVDRPERFGASRKAGAHFGLTPRRYQSGETDRAGAISRAGDASVRVALFEAAHVIMTRVRAWSSLRAWGMAVVRRRGARRAKVALARKLGVVLHRMRVDGADSTTENPPPHDRHRRPPLRKETRDTLNRPHRGPPRRDAALGAGDDGQDQAAGHLGAPTPFWRSADLPPPTASWNGHRADTAQNALKN